MLQIKQTQKRVFHLDNCSPYCSYLCCKYLFRQYNIKLAIPGRIGRLPFYNAAYRQTRTMISELDTSPIIVILSKTRLFVGTVGELYACAVHLHDYWEIAVTWNDRKRRFDEFIDGKYNGVWRYAQATCVVRLESQKHNPT